MGNAKAKGWGILQSRSLPAAALFFFVILDEIEGFAFVALWVVARRPDLFSDVQSVLFPGAVFVSAVATALFFWRRRDSVVEPPAEAVSADVLVQRIGVVASAPQTPATVEPVVDTAMLWATAKPPTESKWRRALR